MIFRLIKKAISSLFMMGSSVLNGSPLKSDETVIFFPTSAHLNKDLQWEVPIHHWVFEKEDQSLLRKLTQKLLAEFAEALDISAEQANSKLFKSRVKWFIVDNERNKTLDIFIDDLSVEALSAGKVDKDNVHTLNTTQANGHGKTSIYIPKSATKKTRISYKALSEHDSTQEFMGETQLIPETGLSVISDIDDTIKVSEVLDKKALIRNTFLEEYQTIPNMPELYKDLENQGAYFHYVSASPWQIYPSLKPFMEQYYPFGSYSLRDFRLKDSTIIKFLQSSKAYKLEKIRHILQKYPAHQFILIGDSGEYDPEIYAEIYHEFFNNIERIFIRAVPGSNFNDSRFQDTFAGVPKTVWRILNDTE